MDSPSPSDTTSAAELGARLRFALSLVETGVDMTRCRLRREHPHADDSRIQELVNAWLLERSMDEFVDRPDLVVRRPGTAP